MVKYEIIPFGFSINDLYSLSKEPCDIVLSKESQERIIKSNQLLEKFFSEENFSKNISKLKASMDFAINLNEIEIRATIISLVYSLSLGYSGVRLQTINKILELIRKNVLPTTLKDILKNWDLTPYEELAITNELKSLKGLFVILYYKTKELLKISEVAYAILIDILRIQDNSWQNPHFWVLKPHLGQLKFYENLTKLLVNWKPGENKYNPLISKSQIFAIFHQILDFIEDVLEIEINSNNNSFYTIIEEEKVILQENYDDNFLLYSVYYLIISIINIISSLKELIEHNLQENIEFFEDNSFDPNLNYFNSLEILKKKRDQWENLLAQIFLTICNKIEKNNLQNYSLPTQITFNFIEENPFSIKENFHSLLERIEKEVGELF